MFFKRQDFGRVYVIKLVMPDTTVVFKVGMTNSSRATDRMMEILRSWFNAYRFVPHAELKLDREVNNPLAVEKLAHKALADYQWTPGKDVQGKTEMFSGLQEERLIHFVKHLDVGQEADNIHLMGSLIAGNYDR